MLLPIAARKLTRCCIVAGPYFKDKLAHQTRFGQFIENDFELTFQLSHLLVLLLSVRFQHLFSTTSRITYPLFVQVAYFELNVTILKNGHGHTQALKFTVGALADCANGTHGRFYDVLLVHYYTQPNRRRRNLCLSIWNVWLGRHAAAQVHPGNNGRPVYGRHYRGLALHHFPGEQTAIQFILLRMGTITVPSGEYKSQSTELTEFWPRMWALCGQEVMPSNNASGLAFFQVSVACILCCLCCCYKLRAQPLVEFYMKASAVSQAGSGPRLQTPGDQSYADGRSPRPDFDSLLRQIGILRAPYLLTCVAVTYAVTLAVFPGRHGQGLDGLHS
eukprot:scaffold3065_cov389-Prasinococcus_capsulatus_cf.AAC.2